MMMMIQYTYSGFLFLSFATQIQSFRFALVPKTTDNPFFILAHHGCQDAIASVLLRLDGIQNDSNSTCIYGGVSATTTNPNPDPDGALQAAYVQSLLLEETGQPPLDGIAISVKNPDLMRPLIDEAVHRRKIPVVTFDSDQDTSARIAYIGTDNVFLGETMAKVAQQIRPTGGTFAILWGDDAPNVQQRDQGFRDHMNPDLWTECHGSPVNYNRDLDRALTLMEDFAQQNATVIVTTTGGPLFHDDYAAFYKRHTHRNVTIISADDFAVQIDHLSRGYVQGLVGQMPYEMGYKAAQVLYDIKTGNFQGPEFYGTNLITHIQVPLVLPELVVDHNLIGRLRILGYTLMGVIYATALGCGIWTFVRRNTTVIKAAQPSFLLLLTLGVIILGSTIIPLSIEDNGESPMDETSATWVCMSIPWLACCGFTISFSALFSKTIRFHRILEEARGYHRVRVQAVDVLLPFTVLLGMNVLVLLLWTFLDPLMYVRKDNAGLDGWNRIISTYGACRCENHVAYTLPLAGINTGVLVCAIYQAYKSRKIRLEFAESKYVAMCIILLLESLLIGTPILFVVRNSPQAYYLAVVLMLFVICLGVLLLIFVPKMLISAEYSHRSLTDQRRMIMEGIRESVPEMKGQPGSGRTARSLDIPVIEPNPGVQVVAETHEVVGDGYDNAPEHGKQSRPETMYVVIDSQTKD
eukprot:scaffold4990_cov176-Amphora_coffeaeformis.AAC.7